MKTETLLSSKVNRHSHILFHLLALAIVAVWGTTFVSTKVLLLSGLGPSEILLYRFTLAYIGICLCSRPFKLFADNLKDELYCLLAGLLGGTMYFITENTALEYTLISNVALICSISPLLTILIQSFIINRTKPERHIFTGSAIAFIGVGAVIFNSKFVFDLNPLGDLLCFFSALSWALYTLVTKYLSPRYSAMFIVRKTFFYGIVTLIPFLIAQDALTFSSDTLLQFDVWSRLLFLGIIASFLCFMLWNVCMRKLNTLVLTNYIYLSPVVSIITSNLILGESVNIVIITGVVLVIAGMYFAGKKGHG